MVYVLFEKHQLNMLMTEKYSSDEMMTIAASRSLTNEDVCFVGDDVVDIELMKNIGLAITVPNANYNDVKKNAHWVTPRLGGHGAVRDVCDLIYLAKKA